MKLPFKGHGGGWSGCEGDFRGESPVGNITTDNLGGHTDVDGRLCFVMTVHQHCT